ncbi:MAG: hypothetical protein ACLQNE_12165 [Thermoguttaceae bacterium]
MNTKRCGVRVILSEARVILSEAKDLGKLGRFFAALRMTVGAPRCSLYVRAPFRTAVLWTAAVVCLAGVAARGQTPDAADSPAWQPPAAEAVRAQAFAWLDQRKADPGVREKAAKLWPAGPEHPPGIILLERLVKTFSLADDNARKLVQRSSSPRSAAALVLPQQSWLRDPQTPGLEANNLRLWYARWLTHERLYDEAQEQLEGLRLEDVVDPSSLLFYQALVADRLLNKETGMEAIARLLEGADRGPRRYATIARLMEADLKDLKEDSLDHIARRMADVERRLDLGRAGSKVRGVEDGIIASLDKLIKQMEDQQQGADSSGGNSLQSSSPAQISKVRGGKGKGEVVHKNIGNKDGWGDLPPKQREEALQQIGREFPAHYRDVIEQYFRKLASEGTEK